LDYTTNNRCVSYPVKAYLLLTVAARYILVGGETNKNGGRVKAGQTKAEGENGRRGEGEKGTQRNSLYEESSRLAKTCSASSAEKSNRV
jgi:hypothetical protein